MRTGFMKTLYRCVVIVVVLSVVAVAQEQTGKDLVTQLTGKAQAPARDAAQLTEAYQKAVDYLLPLMSAGDVGSRYDPQLRLQDMGSYATRPGAEAERLALATVLVKTVEQTKMENTVRNWFVLQLERIGKAESVPLLTKLLSDADSSTRDYARRALEKNPDASATEAFLKELAGARDSGWKMGLISALGARRAQPAVTPLTQSLNGADPNVAQAAAGALARIGGQESAQALLAVLAKPAGPVSAQAAQGLIDMAGEMATGKDTAGAAKIYGAVYDWASKTSTVPIGVRVAAATGLVVTDSNRGPKEVVTLIQDGNPKVRQAAIQAARLSTSKAVPQALTALLPQLKSDSQVQVLGLIADRKDTSAESAVIQALAVKDEAVSVAAAGALRQLGTEAGAQALFEVAVGSKGNVQKAAQAGLVAMAGPQADTLLKAKAASGEAKTRTVAIDLLGQRRADGAAKLLLTYAADADEAVSAAAFQAMVNVAESIDVGTVTDLVAKAKSNTVRTAGVVALKAVLAKAQDKEAAAKVVVDQMNKAEGQTKLALLTALNAAGGVTGLKAVTDMAQASDEAARDAGIRTLSEWPGYEAVPVLMDIVLNSQTSLTHSVLATRGALRLIAAASAVPIADRVTLCLKLLDQARRIEEKRLAITTLESLPSPQTVSRLLELAKDESLKNEAALAALNLAAGMLRTDRAAAQDLAQKILDLNISPELNTRANSVISGRGGRGMRMMRGTRSGSRGQ